jgi:hypothetical protein
MIGHSGNAAQDPGISLRLAHGCKRRKSVHGYSIFSNRCLHIMLSFLPAFATIKEMFDS